MFRVNEDGFKNRYRNREKFAPHIDCAYKLIYPGGDNSDYDSDINKKNRKQNVSLDKYDIMTKVNGDLHVKVLSETPD